MSFITLNIKALILKNFVKDYSRIMNKSKEFIPKKVKRNIIIKILKNVFADLRKNGDGGVKLKFILLVKV